MSHAPDRTGRRARVATRFLFASLFASSCAASFASRPAGVPKKHVSKTAATPTGSPAGVGAPTSGGQRGQRPRSRPWRWQHPVRIRVLRLVADQRRGRPVAGQRDQLRQAPAGVAQTPSAELL